MQNLTRKQKNGRDQQEKKSGGQKTQSAQNRATEISMEYQF